MKKCTIIFGLILVAFNSVAQTIPSWKITDLEKFIQGSATPTVINFWATWCKPCGEEIPYFIETANKYKNENVKLLLVSLDMKRDYPGKIINYIKSNHLNAQVVWLDETNADYFCPKVDSSWSGSLPATLFVNSKNGRRNFYEKELRKDEFNSEIRKLIQIDSLATLPKPTGYVNDFENILTSRQSDTLEKMIMEHEKATSDQIAVVTVKDFSPYNNIEDYSIQLANQWGVGRKDKNNGVMIVVSSIQHKIRIQNGTGIVPRMSDPATKAIINSSFIPSFKDGKYYDGIKKGLMEIIDYLNKHPG